MGWRAGLGGGGAGGRPPRGGEERFERKGRPFHERLRRGFLEIARLEPERCVVVEASAPPDRVADQVWRAVSGRLLAQAV